MINYLILALSTMMTSGKALFCKAIGTGKYSRKETAVLNFKAFFVAFICAVIFVIGRLGDILTVSSFSLVMAIFFGLSVALTQIMQAKALGNGSSSIVTLIYSCGFLVPIFYGLIFWGEEVSIYQWLGVALILASLTLIVFKTEKSSAILTWLPFAILAMLGSGINAIFQKTHQYSEFADELPFFLVFALFFSTLFTGAASLVISGKGGSPAQLTKKQRMMKNIVIPICLGICVGMLNFLNLSLSGRLPSVILFPVSNIGGLILTSVISGIIYKDKPTKRQLVGLITGVIAILMVGIL